MRLSERQGKFVTEFHLCGNASEAARRAGYGAAGSRVAAHRLLTNANVKDALAARQRDAASEACLTRQDAISGLQEAIALAQKQGNPAALIAGWREIGRMLGFYEPEKVNLTMSSAGARLKARFESLSDEQLYEIAASNA